MSEPDSQPPRIEPTHQRSPRHLDRLFGDRLVGADVVELGLAEALLVFGIGEVDLPEVQPHQTDEADGHERHLPAPVRRNPHDATRNDDADARARVEDAGGERPLLLREPHADGLDRRREIGGFGETQDEAHDDEAHYRRDQAVRGGRERPQDERESERLLDAEFVDDDADHRGEHGVCECERRGDGAVVHVGPAERTLQRGLEHRQRVAVDVVDGRAEEQQSADHPAVVADLARD
jgi:hypothetical protein